VKIKKHGKKKNDKDEIGNCCLSFPKLMLKAGIRILLILNIAFTDVSSCYFTLSRYHFKWKYTKSVIGVIPLKNSPESSMLSKKKSFHTGFILSLI
jgi:hypothetical protein